MEKVKEFHEAAGLAIDEKHSIELINFRMQLIFEEVKELAEAAVILSNSQDLNEIPVLLQDMLKEMCDVVYVIKGTAVSLGLNFDKAYDLVHKANMTKLPLTKNEVGKIVKGPNYKPAVLEECI